MRTQPVPVHRRDRPWLDAYINIVFGPFDMPDIDCLRGAVGQLAETYPSSRLDWTLDRRAMRWCGGRSPVDFVSEREVLGPIDPGQLMNALDADDTLPAPLALIRYPSYLGVRMSHGLGDGRIMSMILHTVMQTAITGEVASWTAHPTGRSPLTTAVLRTFGRRPWLVRSAIADRYSQDRPPDDGPLQPWRTSRRTAWTSVSHAQAREIAAWAQRSAPTATRFALLIAATLQALQRVGIAVQRDVNILFDLRRYAGDDAIDGNFVVGVPLRITTDTTPVQIADAIRGTTRSARPLATQMLTSMATGRAAPAVTHVDPNRLPRITFSSVGGSPHVDALPLLDTGPATYTAGVEPDGPHGLTFLLSEVRGTTNISASFHDNILDHARIQAALDLVSKDGAGLLDAAAWGM